VLRRISYGPRTLSMVPLSDDAKPLPAVLKAIERS
jgi:hypothetical protein